jgi:thiol-disulfide isomerase/thioredoxin
MGDRILIALLVMAVGVAAYLLLQAWQRRKASVAFAQTGVASTPEPARATILYFRSDHCAPCAAQSRYLDQLAGQLGDAVSVRKIDADVDTDLADAGKLAAQLRQQGEILDFDI